MHRAAEVQAWLLEDRSRLLTIEELLPQFADRLNAVGIPLWRCSLSIPTMHPLVWLRNVTFVEGAPVTTLERPHDVVNTPFYRDSPPARIHRGESIIRRRVEFPDQRDFPVCVDLAAEGGTDYVALPLILGSGRRSFASFATNRAGGFSDDDISTFKSLLNVLALRVEVDAANFGKRHLLEVYLGHNAARRVLEGNFRRGTGELVRAAIWYCDLRGFTALSDARPPLDVVMALDRYFDRVAGAVARHGGEVLKFIGDAVLAIFPVERLDDASACQRALLAAKEALRAMTALGEEDVAAGRPVMDIGIALHVGDVMYGNIGAADRLDFTVIGASVNEVCRLEPLCKPLATRLVCSSAFARAVPDERFDPLGAHQLKGVRAAQDVFTLPGYRLS